MIRKKQQQKKRIQTIQTCVISCHFYGVSPCSLRLNQVQASKHLSLDKRTDASERPINQHHYHIIFSIGHNMPIAGAVTCGNLWNSTMNIWKNRGQNQIAWLMAWIFPPHIGQEIPTKNMFPQQSLRAFCIFCPYFSSFDQYIYWQKKHPHPRESKMIWPIGRIGELSSARSQPVQVQNLQCFMGHFFGQIFSSCHLLKRIRGAKVTRSTL